MSGESDLETRLTVVAGKPATVSNDSVTVSQVPLSQLIEADKYTSAKRATRANGFGIRVFASKPPGGAG